LPTGVLDVEAAAAAAAPVRRATIEAISDELTLSAAFLLPRFDAALLPPPVADRPLLPLPPLLITTLVLGVGFGRPVLLILLLLLIGRCAIGFGASDESIFIPPLPDPDRG
jgi:hypothetical protein